MLQLASHTEAAHTIHAMAYPGVTHVGILSLALSVGFVAGCGGKSADDGTGGAIGAATGGAGASASGGRSTSGGMAADGGAVSMTGGKTATGGVPALTGGMPPTSTGGRINTGGAVATGGSKSGLGGAVATGGKSSVGGTVATGGSLAVGGAVVTGGKSGVGGAMPTGGSLAIGGTSGTGGVSRTGGSSSTGGFTSDAGDPLSAFCQGDQSKILYQGRQLVQAPATNYESGLVMDCCMAYGVNLHSRDVLGFDLDVETIWSAGGSISAGVFTLGTSTAPMRAAVRRSMESAGSSGVLAEGTAELFASAPFSPPFDLGLCLSLYKTATTLYNTLIYVPKVLITSYESRARFQVFLLSDSTITPTQAVAQGLDSVMLAASALLDLSRIAYVSPSADEVGFNPAQKIGDSLQTQLKGSLAVPFVIVADGARISFGTFLSNVSSIRYPGPIVTIESIKTDSMFIETTDAQPDPLKDARAVAALTKTGKLIP
jgi:hypothetical protein